jgi:hypothetical protein
MTEGSLLGSASFQMKGIRVLKGSSVGKCSGVVPILHPAKAEDHYRLKPDDGIVKTSKCPYL